MADMNKIIAKIRALRARAADDASTEAEAAIAMRVAEQLLAEYNLSLDEVDVKAEGVKAEDWEVPGFKAKDLVYGCLNSISRLTGAKCFFHGNSVKTVGSPADVEVALYFLDIVRAAVHAQMVVYEFSDDFASAIARGYRRKQILESFRLGMVSRLAERIDDMVEAKPKPATGTDLILVTKQVMIADWLRDNGINLRGMAGPNASNVAFGAGRSAGDGVSLNRGVSHSGASRLRLR